MYNFGVLILAYLAFANSVYACTDVYSCCPVPHGVCPSGGCFPAELDLCFIIESGAQISAFDWSVVKSFLQDMITELDINNLQVALVTFAQTATVNFNFNSDLAAVENDINNAALVADGNVDYAVGINAAVSNVLGSVNDGSAPNACLFMASTPDTGSGLAAAASALQANCDSLIVVVVGPNINLAQLDIIQPNISMKMSVSGFDDIVQIFRDEAIWEVIALQLSKLTFDRSLDLVQKTCFAAFICMICSLPPPGVVHICPIFPQTGDQLERIGKELADCALMMCEAAGELSDNKIPAVIIDNLKELRKCIMKMIQLMIDGRDIMSSSLPHKKKIKKLKTWLKKVKNQKAAIKKKVKTLWKELTKKQKKKLKEAINKFNKEMKRLCKKIQALIKELSNLLA